MEPLNSSIEVGLRTLILLEAVYPEPLSVGHLSVMDHALLHSEDFGGPPSLLPAIPGRNSELGIKRERIEEGIQVMMRAALIELVADHFGFRYTASDSAASFLDLLESQLVAELRDRAAWVVERYSDLNDEDVSRLQIQWSATDEALDNDDIPPRSL